MNPREELIKRCRQAMKDLHDEMLAAGVPESELAETPVITATPDGVNVVFFPAEKKRKGE